MNIDHPLPCQMPQLRALWQEAFGDSEAALDCFFDHAYAPQRCLCITDGAATVAAAYWFDCGTVPYPLPGEGASGKYAYIYAVATATSHRGRGLCHRLMDSIHALLARRGYAGAMVVPGEESLRQFYAGMGYENFGGVQQLHCLAAQGSVAMHPVDAAEFSALRRRFLPAGAVVQEGENLAYLQAYAQFFAGEDFLLTALPDGESVLGLELLGNAAAAPGIVKALGAKSGRFQIPGGGLFAMYQPLNCKKPPTYFGFAFD